MWHFGLKEKTNMKAKIDIQGLKRLIRESRMEEEYRHKFVENFKDVRNEEVLSEQELDTLAEILFKEIFSK
tara:strand:- start:2 stop:214 length:213 start_codon:yes stop_codon:yes gene_type:complete